MKHATPASLLACAALCLTLNLATTSAKAEMVYGDQVYGYNYGYNYGVLPTYASYYNGYRVAYADPTLVNYPYLTWDTRWHYAHTRELPLRYGNLAINEDNLGTIRHYAVTLNSRPVLYANNQPGILRVSKTFALDHEDAVIFTAYQGDGVCAYKNYLLTVHSDGSFNQPKEVGNCGSSYEAHVANGALIMNFPMASLANGWASWDMWRYQNDELARM